MAERSERMDGRDDDLKRPAQGTSPLSIQIASVLISLRNLLTISIIIYAIDNGISWYWYSCILLTY